MSRTGRGRHRAGNGLLELQPRIESSLVGRAAISSFLVLTLTSLLVANLPDSSVRREAWPFVHPYVAAAGIEQNWGVFAPDPRRVVLDLEARITYTDGSRSTWRVPDGGPGLAAYRDYHWRKWVEWVTLDSHQELWTPAAAWIARQAEAHGRLVAEVTLVRRWYEVAEPGEARARQPQWQEFAYHTLRLRPVSEAATRP